MGLNGVLVTALLVATLAVHAAAKGCDPVPQVPFGWQPKDKSVALTFNDGPDQGTAAVLDVLAAEGVKATFFINTDYHVDGVVNINLRDDPTAQAILKRIVDEGHQLGSHTATHAAGADIQGLAAFGDARINNELMTVKEVVKQLGINTPLTLVRAPYGAPFESGSAQDQARVSAVLGRHGVHIGWSCNREDFNYRDPEDVFNAYKECVDKGVRGPVLMHSATNLGMGQHPRALTQLIQAYKAAGYKFVAVEDYVREIYGKSSDEVVLACNGASIEVPKASPAPTPATAIPVPEWTWPAGQYCRRLMARRLLGTKLSCVPEGWAVRVRGLASGCCPGLLAPEPAIHSFTHTPGTLALTATLSVPSVRQNPPCTARRT